MATVTVTTTSYVQLPDDSPELAAEDIVTEALLADERIYLVKVQRTINRERS